MLVTATPDFVPSVLYLCSYIAVALVFEMDNPFDRTLILKNVVNSIETVNDWYGLGLQLDIKDCYLERIRSDRRDIEPCKREMVRHWLKNGATWQKLCDALEKIGERRVARQIVSDYPTLKTECEKKAREIPQNLCKLEEENTNDRIEDEKYKEWQRSWEEEKKIQQKPNIRTGFESSQQENEGAIRDALRNHGIEWVYDALVKCQADREELEHLKEKVQTQTEGGRTFKERAKKLKRRKEALCSRAQEFEEMEEYLHIDERELKYRVQELQRLDWMQWFARLSDVIDCYPKLIQCRGRLRRCQEQSRISKEALRRSEFQLSDCRKKIESCISELRYLNQEYECCNRSVIGNIEEIKKAASTLETTIETLAKGAAAVGGATGAAVGTAVLPVVGTAVGGAAGAAMAFFGVKAVGSLLMEAEERLVRSQLTRCNDELKAYEKTQRECQAMAEGIKNDIDELENLTRTIFK